MNPWSNDDGCEIFFEKVASITEQGEETGYATYAWRCACNRRRDDYESLPECVRDARAHIEE